MVSRAKRCGSWPAAFCRHILGAVEQVLGDLKFTDVGVLEIFPAELDTEGDVPPDSSHTTKDQEVAFRLHVNYGHPSNDTLARALRLGGARQSIVEAAKQVKCGTCDRVKPPKAPPKVSTQRATSFNEAVGLDIFFIHDCSGKAHKVLSMVDLATTYHVARLAQHRTTSEIAALFFEGWVGVFGPRRNVCMIAAPSSRVTSTTC